ncbi:uncharacterized protein LOC136042042 [Artemia franciscana]|uniref:uncharacterized protein LOC136042042 n=1 Tax=Artemia franciscana TaxID=6661 RepID=UPI0032DB67BE
MSPSTESSKSGVDKDWCRKPWLKVWDAPNELSHGQLMPLLKKWKPANVYSSYHPIIVLLVLCKLLEILILSNARHCCQIPNHQFGFMVELGCADALFALAAILSDSEPLLIGSFDVSWALDLSVHAQILLET